MTCPNTSTIPRVVWALNNKQINKLNAKVGMLCVIKKSPLDFPNKNVIIVWVGVESIGVISPFMCVSNCGKISFGPDSLLDDKDVKDDIYETYNVIELNLKECDIYCNNELQNMLIFE
jgi:hypothetical protein